MRPTTACTLTTFGAGTRAAWGKPSFWLLKLVLPEPAAGEAGTLGSFRMTFWSKKYGYSPFDGWASLFREDIVSTKA